MDAPDLIVGPFMTVIEPDEMLAEVVIQPTPAKNRNQLRSNFTSEWWICSIGSSIGCHAG